MKRYNLPFLFFAIVTCLLLGGCQNDGGLQGADERMGKRTTPAEVLEQTARLLPDSSKQDPEWLLQLYQQRLIAFSELRHADSAFQVSEKMRRLAANSADSATMALSIVPLFGLNLDFSQYQRLTPYIPPAMAFFRQNGMAYEQGAVSALWGIYQSHQGHFSEAQTHLLEAYRIFGRLVRPEATARICNAIGTTYAEMGSLLAAHKYYNEGLELARQKNDSAAMANILVNLGIDYRRQHPDSALAFYARAGALVPLHDSGNLRLKISYNRANLYADLKNHNKAEAAYLQLLAESRENHQYEGVVMAYNGLASVRQAQGQLPEAVGFMEGALHLADSMGMTRIGLALVPELEKLYTVAGNYRQALAAARRGRQQNDSLLGLEKQLAVHALESNTTALRQQLETEKFNARLLQGWYALLVVSLLGGGGLYLWRQHNQLIAARKKVVESLLSQYKQSRATHDLLPGHEEPVGELQPGELVLFQKLRHYFEVQQPYLYPSLDIEDVSPAIGTSPETLLQLIRMHTGKDFAAFANRYRVKTAIQLLEEAHFGPLKLSVVAMQSGFPSHYRLIEAFQAVTGMHPEDFRRELLRKEKTTHYLN